MEGEHVMLSLLSPRAHATVCGLVGRGVTAGGIFPPSDVWDELRRAFPLAEFFAAVNDGHIEYDPDAGE